MEDKNDCFVSRIVGEVRAASGRFSMHPRITSDSTIEKHDPPLRNTGHGGVMRDHHHRVALGRQLLKQGKNLFALTAVQRAGRLICKNYLPAVHQCSGDRHPLLLATGKFGRQVRFATVQPNRPQKTFRLPSALLRWDASVPAGNSTFRCAVFESSRP